MKHLFTKMWLIHALMMSVLISCDDDEDTPDPSSDGAAAGFTFSANELEVTFTNTSTNADSYSWDFGDGSNSTEENPVHTFSEAGTYSVALTATYGDSSDVATQSVTVDQDPLNARLKTGFVVVAQTEEETAFAQYFPEMPSGTIDITQGTAYQQFFPLATNNGALYMNRTDGSAGFAKMGVNGNGEIVEDGIISTLSSESFVIAVRDGEFGVFHDRNTPDAIVTFNPSTMEVTGSIDMTAANAHVDTAAVRYQDFIFRGTSDIFAPIRLEAGGNIPNVPLARVDVASGAAVDVMEFENGGDLLFLNSSRHFFDENDNFYFFHAGNISFPTVSGAILRILAGANDYDPDYNFNVPEINNQAVIGAGSFLTVFNYHKDNVGYALANEAVDQRIFDLITERGGVQNLTEADIDLIFFYFFTSPTGAYVKVDLATQGVEKIAGLPPLSPFDASSMAFINDVPHFAIANPTVNAYYKLDEITGEAVKVFDMTGAGIVNVFDLSATIQ